MRRTVLSGKKPQSSKTSAGAYSANKPDSRFVGLDQQVPLLDGSKVRYINFDNAASTPSLKEVLDKVNQFMPWYSSVHRGTGYKSLLASKAYDDARDIVAKFFGAHPRQHVVIFGKNTTEAINKLSYRLPLNKDDIVLVSMMEHHSNDLPWRARATVKHIKVDGSGRLDEGHYQELMAKYNQRVKLVAVSGASNVTGYLPDIKKLARLAHQNGSQIFVDCAQLAPHRQVKIGDLSDPEHLDYIAVSAHKMYAPFGTGALIGRRDTFEQGQPDYCGGGTIDVVTVKDVQWTIPPYRDEAGSPNVVGAVAMAVAINELNKITMAKVATHEAELTAYTLEKFKRIPEVKVYGDSDPTNAPNRLGVVAFNIKGLPNGLVAAILGTEWGIGVRNGCFCAHPYVVQLLEYGKVQIQDFRDDVLRGNRTTMPGLVRISFGLYNSEAEIDRLVLALQNIANGKFMGKYKQNIASGDYIAAGWQPDFQDHYSF